MGRASVRAVGHTFLPDALHQIADRKGAFWANYLSAAHVTLAGGEETLRAGLNGMRVESLNHGGLLVVATDSPLPADTEENRARFLRLSDALRPAFLSRDALPELKRAMLGYFFR